jgi:hypothetical protein
VICHFFRDRLLQIISVHQVETKEATAPANARLAAELPRKLAETAWMSGRWRITQREIRAAAAITWSRYLKVVSGLVPYKIEQLVESHRPTAQPNSPLPGRFYDYERGRFPSARIVNRVERVDLFTGSIGWIRHPLWAFLDPGFPYRSLPIVGGCFGADTQSPLDHEIAQLIRHAFAGGNRDSQWIVKRLIDINTFSADVALLAILRGNLAMGQIQPSMLIHRVARPRLLAHVRDSDVLGISETRIMTAFDYLHPDRFRSARVNREWYVPF